jgi:hypothetical protein
VGRGFGSVPFTQEKIMAKKPSDANPSIPVNIVITAPHVYLPLDEDGHGRVDWQDVTDTTKVDKRARLQVPADLAKFLSDRDQAEIL